jgi:oxygen-independent coproporphyrinogen-3 oxidase
VTASDVRIDRLVTGDGVALALHHLGATTDPHVLLVPGTFSNHTFWLGTRGTGFARAAADAGFQTWSLDPRGHGASQRPRRHERWDFDDWAREDVPAALRAATVDGTRAVVIGHSAGGAAILAALAAHVELRPAVRGVITLGTPVPWQQKVFRGLAGRLIRTISRRLRSFPARALRLGPEDELAGVMEQWMGWNFDGRWLGDDGTDYGARLAEIMAPTLVVAGAADRIWAPPAAVRGLYDLVGSPAKRFLLCGRASGFAKDYGHVELVVSRAARHEVWPRLIAWMRALP